MSSYDDGNPALAERMYESLPVRQTFCIRFIGVQGQFVSLIGHDADSRALLAPESVVITFTQPPPEDKEPRVIRFAPADG